MLTALLASAALQVVEPQDARAEEPLWPLRLSAGRVEDLPRDGFLVRWSRHAGFQAFARDEVLVESTGRGLELSRDTGFERDLLRERLEAGSALAAAENRACTGGWRARNLAGIAGLLTDGRAVVLELELYDGADPSAGWAYFARFPLGSRGLDLARAALTAPPRDSGPLRGLEQVQSTWSGRPAVAVTGQVDSRGLRQDPGSARRDAAVGSPALVVETAWPDGRPHGATTRTQGVAARESGAFRQGLLHGRTTRHSPDGGHLVEERHDGERRASGTRSTAEDRSPWRPAAFPETLTSLHARHARDPLR